MKKDITKRYLFFVISYQKFCSRKNIKNVL